MTALDNVCAELLRAERAGRHPSVLRLHPDIYRIVAAEKADDVAHGNPLLLYGLNVLSDAQVEVDYPEIV